ncbi:RagB/SusD family nutrient uptake outer membrane protein [Persicitalea sp.]|uniref:RagB/SusD family nutrient uptake outer membrane protein n=1 Tax=Persicitalea sp. TaxID=3100273 RepID=UPI003593919B
MNRIKYILALALLLGFTACEEKYLDLQSPTEPTTGGFFSNESELNLALTGVYNSLIFRGGYNIPIQTNMDNSATDIGLTRGLTAGGYEEMGAGSHSPSSGGFRQSYSQHYTGIARANSLLTYMERAKDVVPQSTFDDIRNQALVIRAYHYMYLTEIFGDVPYIETVFQNPADALLPRTPKATIAEKIMADLKTAATALPQKRAASDRGRITKAVALGLHARVALYNKKYAEAAASAKEIIDSEAASGLLLHPKYEDLFNAKGQSSSEIMLIMPYKQGFVPYSGTGDASQFPTAQGSRNRGAFNTVTPTQSMIDSYEAVDGKPIDQSAIYDPSKPFANRDPRLAASIVTPQSVWAGLIFESHKDSLTYRSPQGKNLGANRDSRTVSWPASFCGYMWKKYTDEEQQIALQGISYLNFSLMRYAEILLIYAEAKIESGQIDATVLNAINRIRARAYGVAVGDVAKYPAITTTDQAVLRTIIRRERKVELADEGFRLFDIRRWRIAEKVMPVPLYGRILNTKTATKVPKIDADGFVSYKGVESQYDLNTDSRFPNAFRSFNPARDYLCPIPQQEIDTYAGNGATLKQNPGY